MIEAPVVLSRFPVGSSARTIAGRPTRARAMATRCRSPPESWVGRKLARPDSPTCASASSARRYRSAAGTPAYSNPSATFSRTGACSARKNCWNTNPISRARSSDRSRSLSRDASTPPTRTDAAGGQLQGSHDVQERALARPGGTDDRDQLAPSDREGHSSQARAPVAARRTPSSPRRAPEPDRCSWRRHHHVIAWLKGTLDLDPSACGVEQAQPYGDQPTPAAVVHDLDREPASGRPDQRGDRDAQRVVHSLGRDVHLDGGCIETRAPWSGRRG